MKRRVLTIIAADTVEQPQWVLVPTSVPFVELLGHLLTAQARGEAGPASWDPKTFLLFDWSGRRLPADIRVGEVPQPGVVIAATPGSMLRSAADSTGVWMFRQTLMLHENSRDILCRFLSSPDAAVVPSNLKTIDVFVSYSFEDGPLAGAIVHDLKARGLDVFIAESSLSSGRQWREQIRDAVRSSRSAVLLITRASLRSTWVLAEAGALASQGIPTVILYDGVATSEIPAPLRHSAAIEPARQPDRWLDIVGHRASPEPAAV